MSGTPDTNAKTVFNARLAEVLKKYLVSDDAVIATIALINPIRTVRGIMATQGEIEPEHRMGALQMLIDQGVNLPVNPWFQQHGVMMMAVYRIAVQGYLDSVHLMDREQKLPTNVDRTSVRVRIVGLGTLWYEIAVTALTLTRPDEDLTHMTVDLREELSEL